MYLPINRYMVMKLINLELFFVYSDKNFTQKAMYDFSLNLAKKDIENSRAKKLCYLLLLDGFLYNNNSNFLNFLTEVQEYAKSHGVEEQYLIVGIGHGNFSSLSLDKLDIKIINYDYMLNGTIKSYANRFSQWNSKSTKFLFLTGKPSRHNRITLLNKFYKNNLLKYAEWSFYKPDESDSEWCRSALKDLSDTEYENFLNACEKQIDNRYAPSKHYTYVNGKEAENTKVFQSDFSNDVVYVDSDVYSETCFSVISEGLSDENGYAEYLTEKTYRPIINNHPFIMVSNRAMFEYLQNQGYRTFIEYFPVPEYYKISDTSDFLNAVIENTKYFLQNYSKFKKSIQSDIDFNSELLFKKANDCKNVRDFLISKGADPAEVDYYLNHTGMSRLIRIYKDEEYKL